MPTTFSTFASELSTASGYKIAPTKQNQLAIVTWCVYEGSPARCNVLDDTLAMPGSWPLKGNSANVQNYESVAESIQAYLITLAGRSFGYPAIMSAFAKGDCACEVTEAIANSGWGTWYRNPTAAIRAVEVVNSNFAAYGGRVIVGS